MSLKNFICWIDLIKIFKSVGSLLLGSIRIISWLKVAHSLLVNCHKACSRRLENSWGLIKGFYLFKLLQIWGFTCSHKVLELFYRLFLFYFEFNHINFIFSLGSFYSLKKVGFHLIIWLLGLYFQCRRGVLECGRFIYIE